MPWERISAPPLRRTNLIRHQPIKGRLIWMCDPSPPYQTVDFEGTLEGIESEVVSGRYFVSKSPARLAPLGVRCSSEGRSGYTWSRREYDGWSTNTKPHRIYKYEE